jgi:acyl-lipid omega-6 desaturase (Delta-12 desaturase)
LASGILNVFTSSSLKGTILDQVHHSGESEVANTRDWMKVLQTYRIPSLKRSIFEIFVTLTPLVGVWLAALWSLDVSYWLTLLICIPGAFLLVRLFIIQHDCGHGAFFRKRRTNDWVGRIIGIFTLTPYDVWKRSHAIHHAHSGNLDHRGTGDIDTLTVEEYLALPRWRQMLYRLYRHPAIMFGVGPAYIFLLDQRLPLGQMRAGWRPWASALLTNLGIIVVGGALMWLVGWKEFLMIQLPMTVMGASIGVWLFYIQHQFEETFWAEGDDWNHTDAALYGSSHYDLPPVLRWLTGNIGIHHVHHLYSRIPFYRLTEVLHDYPELADVRRVTLWESFAYARLRLWDHAQKRLVPIQEVQAMAAAAG